MAKRSLVIDILGNNKVGRAVKDAMGELSKLGSVARSIGHGIGTVFKWAAAGIGVAAGALAYATKAYMAQEDAENDLSAALSSRMEKTDAVLAALKAEAKEIQKNTTYGDEFVMSLQAQAYNLGFAWQNTTKAVKAAMAFAKVYRTDVASALTIVSKARVGETSTLKRYGIVLDDAMTDAQKYDALMAILASKYRLVTAETNTTSGAFKQFKENIGEVWEGLGEAFAKGVGLRDIFRGMSEKAAALGDVIATKLTPHFKALRKIMDSFLAGDTAKAMEGLRVELDKVIAIVGPPLEMWGERAGIAMWNGFKRAAKGAAYQGAEAVSNKSRSRFGASIKGMGAGLGAYSETEGFVASRKAAWKAGIDAISESIWTNPGLKSQHVIVDNPEDIKADGVTH